MTELALDDTERVLHLDADAGLDALDLIGQHTHRVSLVQQLAQARSHGHMPLHIFFGVRPLVRTPVAGIGKDICLLSMQQAVGFDHIVDVTPRGPYCVVCS